MLSCLILLQCKMLPPWVIYWDECSSLYMRREKKTADLVFIFFSVKYSSYKSSCIGYLYEMFAIHHSR